MALPIYGRVAITLGIGPHSSFVWLRAVDLLWPPYVIGQTIIFLPCDLFLSSSFYSSPNISGLRLDVYHTSTHGVALVRI